MKELLTVSDLHTYFYSEAGVIKAVNGVSFSLSSGEVLGIVGESGSGKSVTALSIPNLIPSPPGKIVQGTISVHGQTLTDMTHQDLNRIRGKDIGLIFQEPMTSLNPVFKIDVQLNEVLMRHTRCTWQQADAQSIEMLDQVGIPDAHKRIRDYPHHFSGGMRQRVMIAMALLCNPALLIADEPTTALDVTIQAQILDLMYELKEKKKDSAILFITHDLAVVAELCDRVIVMYAGKIQEIASVYDLFKNPIHPYTKGLLASIPHASKKSGSRLKAIPGTVPSLLNRPEGCVFCSRFAKKECACGGTGIEPELIEIKKGHWARVKQ